MNALARRAALLVLTVLVAMTSAHGASARENESFGLTPYPEDKNGTERLGFDVPLETGATFEDAVKIYNRTNQTLPLAVYPADAEATEDDTITAGLRTNDPKGVGTWIDLARDSVELAPRREIIVTFRVNVKSADPSPKLGAIVVENTSPGLAAAQRLHLVVRTVPANTPTTSVRVRPLLIRSPWVIIAMLGLLAAIALVWVGTRRARRAKDVLVPAGELERATAQEDEPVAPDASRPVIKRLGVTDQPTRTATAVLERSTRTSPTLHDDRPLLDDAFLVEVDPEEEDASEDIEDSAESEIEGDIESDDLDEADHDPDVEDDIEEDTDDADLPPARHVRPRSSQPRRRATPEPRTKKAARKKPAPKASTPRRKPAAAKKSISPRKRAAKTTARKRTTKPRANKPAYIPLDEL